MIPHTYLKDQAVDGVQAKFYVNSQTPHTI